MNRLSLAQVTLCAVTTRTPALALRSLQRRRAAGRNDANTRVPAALSGRMQTVQGWAR